jgi:hypothetical protein
MKDWADRMHYERTGEPIRAGIRWLRQQGQMPSTERNRAIAWLFGYTAHVGTDLTVHPVVEACVGKYAEHPTDHRICEMNQDVWIWRKRNLSTVDKAEYFDPIMKSTSAPDGGIAIPIRSLWESMLRDSYPAKAAILPPDIDAWHNAYGTIINVAEEGPGIMFSFTRHLLLEHGLTYPPYDEMQMQYIEGVHTPFGDMHYDEVFETAVNNVATLWTILDRALWGNEDTLPAILAEVPDADLDTGRYFANDELVFWRTA